MYNKNNINDNSKKVMLYTHNQRVITLFDANFLSILYKKITFFILYIYFYKTYTSVFLFYTFIQ